MDEVKTKLLNNVKSANNFIEESLRTAHRCGDNKDILIEFDLDELRINFIQLESMLKAKTSGELLEIINKINLVLIGKL